MGGKKYGREEVLEGRRGGDKMEREIGGNVTLFIDPNLNRNYNIGIQLIIFTHTNKKKKKKKRWRD